MITFALPNSLYRNPKMGIHNNHPLTFPFLFVSLLSFSLLLFSLYTRRRRRRQLCHHHSPPLITDIVRTIDSNDHTTSIQNLKPNDSNPNNSLLLEILPALYEDNQAAKKSESTVTGDEECEKKKKKKRGKKKRSDADDSSKTQVVIKEGLIEGIGKEKKNADLVCLYPFTSSSSATQRKIKQQYDQLVKSHESDGLTLLQVGEFANCLVEARNELKHKSEVIHRKFTITNALLFKADRSSFDRLRQQIYKLELEQKRLEEDAFVYNWLQQQLKLSPAYKKMLEIGVCMEMKAKSVEPIEDMDSDVSDISFEELLAQEKKDSFLAKKGETKIRVELMEPKDALVPDFYCLMCLSGWVFV